MQLRLIDEALPLGERGAALFCMEESGARLLKPGVALIDARGNRHRIERISEQDGVWSIYLPDGDADYFARLFRDVRLDGTLMTAEDGADA